MLVASPRQFSMKLQSFFPKFVVCAFFISLVSCSSLEESFDLGKARRSRNSGPIRRYTGFKRGRGGNRGGGFNNSRKRPSRKPTLQYCRKYCSECVKILNQQVGQQQSASVASPAETKKVLTRQSPPIEKVRVGDPTSGLEENSVKSKIAQFENFQQRTINHSRPTRTAPNHPQARVPVSNQPQVQVPVQVENILDDPMETSVSHDDNHVDADTIEQAADASLPAQADPNDSESYSSDEVEEASPPPPPPPQKQSIRERANNLESFLGKTSGPAATKRGVNILKPPVGGYQTEERAPQEPTNYSSEEEKRQVILARIQRAGARPVY